MATIFDMPPASAGFLARGRWLIDRLMVDLGITENQAAGIVGNIGFESGGLTKLREIGQPDGVGGYGWAQWTADRRQSFLGWAAGHDLAWTSDEANYGYLLVELRGAYKNTVDALKRTDTMQEAVFSVGQTYERPGGTTPDHLPGFYDRMAYAQRALDGIRKQETPVISDNLTQPRIGDLLISASNATRALQSALAAAGYRPGPVDGIDGDMTKAAVARWKAAGAP